MAVSVILQTVAEVVVFVYLGAGGGSSEGGGDGGGKEALNPFLNS